MKNFFATLNKITLQTSTHLCTNLSQISLYEYIRSASIGWRRIYIRLDIQDTLKSNIKLQLPRIPITKTRLYEARSSLIHSQVLIVKDNNIYCLNFPLILRVLCYIYGEEFKLAPSYHQEISDIYSKVVNEMKDHRIIEEVPPLPTCEEIFNKMPQKVKSKKTLAVVPTDSKLTVPSLLAHIVRIFKQYGLSVYPYLMEHDPPTMNIEIGCLKGLITKYRGQEAALLKFLAEAAINWTFLCKEAEKEKRKGFIFGQADAIVLYQNHDFIVESLKGNLGLLKGRNHAEH